MIIRQCISSKKHIMSLLHRLMRFPCHRSLPRAIRSLCTDQKDEIPSLTFAKAFEKFEQLKATAGSDDAKSPITAPAVKEDVSFLTLLRNCPLMQLGDPAGRIVTGQIFHLVNNDLYVDFGGKFHCVCPRPSHNAESYVRGAKVKLRLHSLEMSERFMGAESDVTLLEADASLIGLIWSPVKSYPVTDSPSYVRESFTSNK